MQAYISSVWAERESEWVCLFQPGNLGTPPWRSG